MGKPYPFTCAFVWTTCSQCSVTVDPAGTAGPARLGFKVKSMSSPKPEPTKVWPPPVQVLKQRLYWVMSNVALFASANTGPRLQLFAAVNPCALSVSCRMLAKFVSWTKVAVSAIAICAGTRPVDVTEGGGFETPAPNVIAAARAGAGSVRPTIRLKDPAIPAAIENIRVKRHGFAHSVIVFPSF